MTTITSFTSLSHDPQQQAVAITKLRASLKERAAGSCGTLTQLISDQTTDTPVDIHAGLGNPVTVKRSLRRERANHMPKNPTSLSELTLDGEWTTTVDGDPFLIYDNGVDTTVSILLIGSLTASGRIRPRLPLQCYVMSLVNHQPSVYAATHLSSRQSYTLSVLTVVMVPSQFQIH